MAARDSAQLILEVDARIATAQRAINQLARSIQQDTAGMDSSLNKIEQSSERVGRSLGGISQRTRSGFTQLSFQIGDVTQGLAMGTKASTIFAQQSGQVIQALQVMGGEGNKFLQFLGGPWGLAISTAVVVLGTLGSKLFESGDEVGKLVDKMREQARQADLNRQADEAWKHTVEGLTEAIRKRREEQEKARQSDVTAEKESLLAASEEVLEQRRNLDNKRRELDEAAAKLDRLRSDRDTSASPEAAASSEAAIATAAKRVATLRAEVDALRKSVLEGMKNVRNAQAEVFRRQAEGVVDPLKAQTDSINAQIDALDARFTKGAIGPAAYRKEIERLTKALKDAQEAARATKKGIDADLTSFINPVGGGTIRGTFGEKRPGHNHAGVDLAVPVGTNVSAAAGGTVVEVGTLPGYGNVVIIDHGRGTTTRYAHLSKFLVSKGQQVGQGDVIALSGGARGAPGSGNSQGPHVHYEVRQGGRPVDPRKGLYAADPALAGRAAIRSAETEADRAQNRAQAFAAESERLERDILQAKNRLLEGTNAQADAAIALLEADHQDYASALQRQVQDDKLNATDAETLVLKHRQLTDEKEKAVEIARQVDNIRRQSEIEQRQFQYRVDDLRFADEMAKTQAERRRIELQILDAVYEQKRLAAEANLQQARINGDKKAEADALAVIDRLPTEKAQDRARVVQGTMNPLEAWAQSANLSAEQIIEAFQSIEAQGLDNLANALTDVIMGTKSLADAFKDVAASIIADILRMTIKMLIFRALSSAFGGLFGGGSTVNLGGVEASNATALGLPSDFFRASGGPVSSGRPYVVGEKGPELFVPSASGRIMPTIPSFSPKGAANDSGVTRIEVFLDNEMLNARVVETSAQVVLFAKPGIVSEARAATTRQLSRRRLGG